MKSTEKATQAAILEYLKLKGVFHWRNNSGAFKGMYNGKKSFIRFGAVGSPDIICILPPDGQFCGIEVKDKKRGRMNKNQIAFKKRVEELGGIYLVARDLDDVITIM